MKNKKILIVKNIPISLSITKKETYISLTDIAKSCPGDPNKKIRNWMRTNKTIEFLILWERLNNSYFKPPKIGGLKKNNKLNYFEMSPKKWVQITNSIGIFSKTGKYGGTYAHIDIALEFTTWLNPLFKLWLLKEFQEFQKLKKNEQNNFDYNWSLNRSISKRNYSIQTDSIKTYLIPKCENENNSNKFLYANEADMLNIILWNMTAKQWRGKNIELTSQGKNIRDNASINELIVLSNLQSINASLITDNIPKKERFEKLKKIAKEQLNSLNSRYYNYSFNFFNFNESFKYLEFNLNY